MSRLRARPLLAIALGALVGAVAVVVAWLVDTRAHQDAVLPNVVLAGESVRGMDADELSELVRRTADAFAADNVQVRTRNGDGGFEATVPELGVAVDQDRTVAQVLAAARQGAPPRRLWHWARSFISPVKVPFAIRVDRRQLESVVAARDRNRTEPVEPHFEVKDGRLVGVEGKNGRGVDPTELADALSLTKPTPGTLVVTMSISTVEPRFAKADAERLAAEAERLLTSGVPVAVSGETATIPTSTLRHWLTAVPGDTSLELAVRDDAEVMDGLAELFPNVGTPARDAELSVSGGAVVVSPSQTGTACCADEARALIVGAILDPAKRAAPVELPLRTIEPAITEEAVDSMGIVEPVASFTTPHNAGEPRVTNIQLIADTVRGSIIPPGGTFSINGTVGPRTKAKGYVEAPIIGHDYKFEQDVGGGVSQFATTLFNAAFFAGLEIPEYYMHGLYISRYPYGREATLSYPGPDLKLYNPTPYGVLIWPTYSSSSITVTLYSTTYFANVDQTGQTKEEKEAAPPVKTPDQTDTTDTTEPSDTPKPEPCVTVTTERTRTYLDGRSVVDRFTGLYAPAEGWTCPNGR